MALIVRDGTAETEPPRARSCASVTEPLVQNSPRLAVRSATESAARSMRTRGGAAFREARLVVRRSRSGDRSGETWRAPPRDNRHSPATIDDSPHIRIDAENLLNHDDAAARESPSGTAAYAGIISPVTAKVDVHSNFACATASERLAVASTDASRRPQTARIAVACKVDNYHERVDAASLLTPARNALRSASNCSSLKRHGRRAAVRDLVLVTDGFRQNVIRIITCRDELSGIERIVRVSPAAMSALNAPSSNRHAT